MKLSDAWDRRPRLQDSLRHPNDYGLTLSTLILFFGLFGVGSAAGNDSLDCGAKSLAIAMISLDVQTDLKDVKSKLGASKPKGYNLADLAITASNYKLQTKLVRTTLENLQRRKAISRFACICWLKENHFVVCIDADKQFVKLADFPEVQTQQLATFLSHWKGECLLLSHNELQSEASVDDSNWRRYTVYSGIGLGLFVSIIYVSRRYLRSGIALCVIGFTLTDCVCGVFAQSIETDRQKSTRVIELPTIHFMQSTQPTIKLGTIPLNDNRNYRTFLLNDLDSDVEVAGLGISCPCIQGSIETGVIRTNTRKHLEFTPNTSRGGVQHSVLTVLTVGDRMRVQIPVDWTVEQPLNVVPQVLSFGEIESSGQSTLKFSVMRLLPNGEERPAKGLKVTTSHEILSAKVKDSEVTLTLSKPGSEGSDSGTIYVADEELQNGSFASFSVSWRKKAAFVVTLPANLNISTAVKSYPASLLLVGRDELPNLVEVTSDLNVTDWKFTRRDKKSADLIIFLELPETSRPKFFVEMRFDGHNESIMLVGRYFKLKQ